MKLTIRCLAVATALLVGGCGLLPEQKDETQGWSAQKLYAEAKDAMNDGVYDKAVKYFEKLEARYPYGRYAQQSQLEVAYAYFKQNEPASAIAACERFIKLHPNHPNVDYAWYLKGLVTFNEDQGLLGKLSNQDLSERDPKGARESFETFKELVRRFPNSKYVEDSVLRMRYLVNSLSSHDVHVARYYYKRGAYVAAVNRAQTVLKDFPNTPATEEALVILVKSYDALGLNDLRDDSKRILQTNFPSSQLLTGQSADANKKPWWQLW